MPEDHLPLIVNGIINAELMSYASLYQDEVVSHVKSEYNPDLFKSFVDALDIKVEVGKEYLEWVISRMFKSRKAFEVLHTFLACSQPSLYHKIHLCDVADKKVVNAFKKYFLCPAKPLSFNRSEDVVLDEEDEEIVKEGDDEDDDEEEKNEEEVEYKKDRVDIDSDDDVSSDEEEEEYITTVLDGIACVFEPEYALTELSKFYKRMNEIKDPLGTPYSSPIANTRPWARAILRELPRMTPHVKELEDFPSIVYDFAMACRKDPYNRAALMILLPDYELKLAEREAARRGSHGLSRGKKMEVIKEIIEHCRPADQYITARPAKYREHLTTAMPIELRKYQYELVQKADSGENTVVVAPTGSGKTVVAAHIMRAHVMRNKSAGKPYRIVMVVPKIPLVEQQALQLYKYVSDVCHTEVLHGDFIFDENRKIDVALCAELLVMTPQVLINLLESVRAKERLFVSDMTLLVLDECHHCDSNHPYAQLMSIIREWQYDKPQIVGLTASLGVGRMGATNLNQAREHVVRLLSRMTATSISTVVKNIVELHEHVQLPVDDIKSVTKNRGELRQFTTCICDMMTRVHQKLNEVLPKMTKPKNEYNVHIPQSILANIKFEQIERYGGILEAIRQCIRPLENAALKSRLNHALDFLKICNAALGMNDLLPASIALRQLINEMDALESKNPSSEFIQDFKRLLNSGLEQYTIKEEDKEMLQILRREIRDQFERNINSRVIIFVSTREMSQHLASYISDNREDLIKCDKECGYLISSKAKGGRALPQSPEEQKNTLKRFREGIYPIMVATTVAEEGLDVPECNLIIKYNMTGNVIALAQQRGRARAKNSKSVLIVLSESVKKRELENVQAEKMMNHVVDTINREGVDRLREDVKRTMIILDRERQLEEDEKNRKDRQLQGRRYEIKCKQCGVSICDSTDIKHGSSHYFSIDRSVWNRLDVRYDLGKNKYIDAVTTVLGRLICKGSMDGEDTVSCGHDLGKVVRYHGCYLPSIKCPSIDLRNIDDGSFSTNNKKWKDVRDSFHIAEITDADVEDMMNAMSVDNTKLFQTLEETCKVINSKGREEAIRKYKHQKTNNDHEDIDSD